jgi:hypothetical protein
MRKRDKVISNNARRVLFFRLEELQAGLCRLNTPTTCVLPTRCNNSVPKLLGPLDALS